MLQAHLYEGYKYKGDRSLEQLTEFVMSNVKVDIQKINTDTWKGISKQNWLLFLCATDMCLETMTMKKLAASLVISVAISINVIKRRKNKFFTCRNYF